MRRRHCGRIPLKSSASEQERLSVCHERGRVLCYSKPCHELAKPQPTGESKEGNGDETDQSGEFSSWSERRMEPLSHWLRIVMVSRFEMRHVAVGQGLRTDSAVVNPVVS